MEREYDNYKLFKYLKPFDNTKLSELKGYDLIDLFVLMDDYLLTLRDKLGLKEETTFGLEVEFEHTMFEDVKDEIVHSLLSDWRVKSDISLYCGAEINTPILQDTEKSWNDINYLCDLLSPLGYTDTRSGGHIHIGSQELGSNIDNWKNFLKTWGVYENIMYRFLDGERLNTRPGADHYAFPVAKKFLETYDKNKDTKDIYALLGTLNIKRYQGVNFSNTNLNNLDNQLLKNTIEFRAPNGTLNPVIWQNNVNAVVKMLDYCKDLNYNNDIIERRREKNKLDNLAYNDLEWYKEIYLGQAIELADMIFHTNIEKIYFLKQYIKSFEVSDEKEEYPQAKTITKKLK